MGILDVKAKKRRFLRNQLCEKRLFYATKPILRGVAGIVLPQPRAKYSIVKDLNRGFGSVRRKGRDPQ
jgi:hypothetical protein